MSKLNDFELKIWLQQWGKYFPEVDEFIRVYATYYDSRGLECSKDNYQRDNHGGSIEYIIRCYYEKHIISFEWQMERWQLEDLDNNIGDIISNAYKDYYMSLNAKRYPDIADW